MLPMFFTTLHILSHRALMVILQSHRTQNMILRCYSNVSAILRRHTKSCLLCFFNNPLFNSQNLVKKYTTMDTRVNGAPGFTSIRSSLAEPGLAREKAWLARLHPQLPGYRLRVCTRSKLLPDLSTNNYRTKETHTVLHTDYPGHR